MKQLDFESKYRADWQAMSDLLDQLEGIKDKGDNFQALAASFPKRYRQLCQQLSIAETRQYSPMLTDDLHQLTLRGHRYLYQQKSNLVASFFKFLAKDFPIALRQQWRFWLFSSLLFYVPALFMGIGCYLDSEFIFSLMDYNSVKDMEFMYDPNNDHLGRTEERKADSDFMMFGYYIMNNVGIDFKTYASGIVFGLGSVFFMVFNGLSIGGVAGHLTQKGYTDTFWPFVSGHSALELTAATIAGAAGLMLGRAVINPQNHTRLLALRKAGIESFPLISGAAIMTFLAAFIEGFWSATPGVPHWVKYSIGISSWIAVFTYLLFAGRSK